MSNIPRLHPDTISEVKDRADIYDVVSEQVVLKRQGKDYVGFCPFHDDKRNPSFTVSPSKQFYYCFSCGAGGNAIKFMMEIGKRQFSEVVLDLAKKYQVPVKTLEPAQRQELQRQLSVREQLYEILALTAKFYEHALAQPQGHGALNYLLHDRQMRPEIIQQFQLGYAPGGWSTLHGYLVEQKNYPVKLVEQAGLIVPRKENSGYYDRFRDRLMIPIWDTQGRVIGFGGRALGDDKPKYLNSPETDLFDKGKTLYGLDRAKAAIAKQDCAVVVEGYFDVIALHAAGITNAVASLGTALSQYQVKMLLRYTEHKKIVFNFDADGAGVKAAERAIGEVASLAYQDAVKLHILNIPNGKDPDDFLKIHAAADYQKLLEVAPRWLEWQIQNVIGGRDLSKAGHLQEVTEAIAKLLGSITNPSTRTDYIKECAEMLSLGKSWRVRQLEEDLRLQVKGHRWHGRSQRWQTPADRSLLEESESQLLRLYLHAPQYRSSIVESLEERDLEFSQTHHRFLWQQILDIESQYPISVQFEAEDGPDLLSMMRDRCTEFPNEMNRVYWMFELDEKTSSDIQRAPLAIRTSLAAIERVMCEKRRRHFLDLWKTTDFVSNPDLGQYYQQKVYAEDQRIKELDHQRQVQFNDLVQMPWTGEASIS
ncbi:DNA primase [filamentous cyanobacterium LEGE 11480]|uniref:DNA primase n=1 Tax=Romeriopsis navalis LEGE 11480 TaxID=2777977 RepID=A0A928Z5P9_9CYAN|nr:DNA primase [Romeriopsis navalis]MBE9031713.1 DNA primase [Romeriopsis navalis LEGE 11480]